MIDSGGLGDMQNMFSNLKDALKLFPIDTTVAKESDSEIIRGQVYDYRAPYWRVQYEDNDWEELSRQEVHRMAGAHQDDT